MKKVILSLLVVLLSLLLTSCSVAELKNSESDTIRMDVNTDDVKIMQLTDIHLTYGFDYLDRKTFNLIDKLIEKEQPDIIIVTGDVFMTIYGKSVFKKFIRFIDSYDIPWSITFGNHEMEYRSIEHFIKLLIKEKTNNLYYLNNPNLELGYENGYANFKIEVFNKDKHILNLYMLDTKDNRNDGIKDSENPYGYLSTKQVAWYSNHVKDDLVKSLAFMHIPLRQYLLYEGEDRFERTWPQAVETGFYESMVNPELGNYKTLGVFVGHDHLNRFQFTIGNDNILLAYGLSSGYNGYGTNDKGARFINYNFNNESIDSYVVGGKELGL